MIRFVADTDDKKTATSKDNSKGHFVKKSFTTSLGETSFKFNFPVDEIEKLSLDTSENITESNSRHESETNDKSTNQNGSSNKDNIDAEESRTHSHSNPFVQTKLAASDNTFKFNFSIEHD